MQQCSQCGKQNKDDLRFCGHCGNKLNNTCPACNFKNLPFQEFCGNCGKQLSDSDSLSKMQHLQQGAPPPGTGGNVSVMTQTQPAAAGIAVSPVTELQQFALMSIEFTNFSKLDGASDNKADIDRFKQQCVIYLEKTLMANNGWFKIVKDNMYFAAFKSEPDAAVSLEKAMQTSLALLQEDFTLNGVTLAMRIGVDIESLDARDSITATTERTVATPGDLVVSERVFRLLAGRYKTRTIGPLTIGGESRKFYRVLGLMPAEGETLTETPAAPSKARGPIEGLPPPPVAEQDLARMLKARKPKEAAAAAPAQAPAPAPLPPQAVEQPVQTAPEPEQKPQQRTRQPLPVPTVEDHAPEMPLSAKISPAHVSASAYRELGRVKYNTPEFGVRKATRLSNVSYRQCVAALADEFLAHAKGMANAKIISVCGTDGLGKSHIVQMARQHADPENLQITWTGAIHYRAFADLPLPMRTWQDLLENLLGFFPEGMPEETIKSEIERFLHLIYDGNPPATVTACLQDLFLTTSLQPMSIELRTRSGQLEMVLGELLRRMASKKPLVLVLEDILFADAASMELLAGLIENGLLDQRIQLVLTQSRDFHFTGRLAEAMRKTVCKEFSVSDLSDTDMEAFMNEGPLGGNLAEFPVALLDRIVGNAHGLPLQMEECLRVLYLYNVLTVDETSGKFLPSTDAEVDINSVTMNLPVKVSDLLLQRIGILSEHSRYILQMAAVLGERFPVSMLMNLVQLPQDAFNEAMTNLYDHGFLIPDAVNTGRFRHGQLWQTIYTAMDPGIRMQLHQLVSQTLESDYKQGLTVNPGLMAWHSLQGQLPNRALTYWNMTGVHMAQVGALDGLNMALFKAIDILNQMPAETETRELENYEHRALVYENLGIFNMDDNVELSTALLEWVLRYRTINNDTARMIEVLGFLASCHEQEGDYPQALATISKNLSLFSKTDYPLEYAALLVSKAEYLYAMGRIEEARQLCENEIEPLYQNQPLEEEPEHFNTCLNGRLLEAQIELEQCNNHCFALIADCLGFSREHGWDGLTIALELAQSRGFIRKGQYEACDRAADDLLTRIEALPEPDWFLAQWGLMAMMHHCDMGDWANSQQLILTVVSKSEHERDYQTWLMAQNYAGYTQLGLGNIAEARRLLEQAVETSAEYKIMGCALPGWRFLAETELAEGHTGVAKEIAENALKLAAAPGTMNHYERFMLTNTLSRCLIATGETSAAGKMLEAQWPEVVKTGFMPIVAQTATCIAELYKKLATQTPSEASKKHLVRSVQFFQKAQGMWLDMGNKHQVSQVREATPKI